MTKNILPIIFLISAPLTMAFGQAKVYPAEIKIVSETDDFPIDGATVEIINSDVNPDWISSKMTKTDGKAKFAEVPSGKVTIRVTKDGYIPLEEKEKITENGNVWPFKLRKSPDSKFYLAGKVTNLLGDPLEGCRVTLNIVGKNMEAITNMDGRFDFVLTEPPLQARYELDFQKKGFKSKTISGEFLERVKMIEDPIKLEKKTIRKSLTPSRFRLGVIGDVNFFLSDMKNNQVINVLSGGLLGLYQLKWVEQKLYAGFGWHLPLSVQTVNSFTTLNGLKSDIETKYKVNSLGFVTLRYYHSLPKEESRSHFSPFLGLTALFVDQKPKEPIFADGNFNEERTSFFRTVPRLTVGISWCTGLFNLEPYLAYSFFQLGSQNFEFNYFGRANPIVVHNRVHHLSFGITCLFALPKN